MKRFSRGIICLVGFSSMLGLLAACGTDNPFSRGPEIIDDGSTSHTPGAAVSFAAQVIPVLSSCESCHASGTGGWTYRGGAEAYTAVQSVINLNDPAESVLLVKGSGGDGHGGGRLFSTSSAEYQVLLDWIAQGGANN